MKKFYDRLTKQQWRVTVPNIKTNVFKKSHLNSNLPEVTTKPKKSRKTLSGSYDVQAAEKNHKRSQSVPNGILVIPNSDTSTSSSETDENYEDAMTSPDKNSKEHLLDYSQEIYAQPKETPVMETSKNLTDANSQYEYDVPKISFSFFERLKSDEEIQNEYEVVVAKSPQTSPTRRKSEVKITLAVPEPDLSNTSYSSETDMSNSDDTKTTVPIKSGSDPNLSFRSEDDELYKVPRSHNQCYRLSQSLNDFNEENIETITTHSSIEHISCSQVILEKREKPPEPPIEKQTSAENLDYIKTRSKLPLSVRRITLLRKPKNKAADSWAQLKSKVNNILSEHAAQQRVGAFESKEKIGINLEDVYKNSKKKCKKAFKNTTKLFNKKKNQENVDPNSETSSQIVKNDAFFAKVELKASDIEYMFNTSDNSVTNKTSDAVSDNEDEQTKIQVLSRSISEEKKDDFDFSTLKHAFRRSKITWEGQNGFDDLRRYVKQGGDFCKELSTILQERAEAETQYAKSLSKLSAKLARACRENVGGLNEAWRAVAVELEARAEGHRLIGTALLEEAAKPLRNLNENQHRARKQAEAAVDKAARGLADWRTAEAKSKKHSHVCARDNEKLQDATLDAKYGKMTLSRSTSLIQLAHLHNHKAVSDKENAKLEGKKRKAEDAVKKADIEYYTFCVRAERARLEWESAVLRGAGTFQLLEEERLNNLKSVLNAYLQHSTELCPRLTEATEKLKEPLAEAEPSKDLATFVSLRQSSQQISEQLLPDFYCEHITLAMNRERRKQALIKLLHLIRQDIERERKSKNGLENLSKAIKQTPNFGAEDSQQSVTEKLYHMKSMLTYLEGARYKVQSALAELDSRPRSGHPLAPHITITRDKSGLQQSILKVPQWLRDEWIEPEKSPLSEKSSKSDLHINEVDLPDPDWTDRGTADGNSNQPDSDFDEFSSQASSIESNICAEETAAVQPIAKCKALYAYTPNLPDELPLRPGDMLSVYRQQDDGWWLGECNGSVGIFPATYVETIPVPVD